MKRSLLLLSLVMGCQPSKEIAKATPDVTYELGEYYFRGPDTLPAGRVNLHVKLAGTEGHIIDLLQLTDGKRLPALMAAGESAYDSAWVRPAGAGVTAEEGSPVYSVVLQPGTYVLLCYFHTDGAPHFAKGMIKEVVVAGPAPEPARAAPAHQVEVAMVDFGFDLPAVMPAGTRTIRVVNPSSQPHEMLVSRLADGVTLEDARAWEDSAESLRKGPSPWTSIGGVGDIAPGDTIYMSTDFRKGTYRLACYYILPGEKQNHAARGMKQYVEVS